MLWSWAGHYSYMPRMRSALLQKHRISVGIGHNYLALKFSIVFHSFWVHRRARGVYQKHNLSRQIPVTASVFGNVNVSYVGLYWPPLWNWFGAPSHEELVLTIQTIHGLDIGTLLCLVFGILVTSSCQQIDIYTSAIYSLLPHALLLNT